MKLVALIMFALFGLRSHYATAHDVNHGVERKILSSSALQNIPGHSLTAVTVELQPGISVPAHKHEGFVFAYVISGEVKSQLNQEAAKVYRAGQSWIEKPGDQHSITMNISNTENAKLLAVFVAPTGAALTTPTSADR
ncbi:cupin domain-containing protein [Exilibacterium tricleocarpae]|uniref:Cupin domain-containing protein n=1 Tax=Exilibacterium tricleocarpae TaxID=2591008 RepID=A0A545U9N2_9GAMM|nr:cupin domain-containing protein [Exilibacterium tricleocarpae]TQV86186.1 cupin domain-containing protein [Exilibacterium tricleocarpae]